MMLTEETEGRLLAKLVRDVLHQETFESLADLVDAVKVRCGRLRIRWTTDGISEAFRIVGSNAALCLQPAIVTPSRHQERGDEVPPISHDDAVACLAQVHARFGATAALPTMPTVERISVRERDCRLAMAIVEQEMLESLRRCDAFEQAIRDDGTS